MDARIRRSVFRLCQDGAAEQALRLLEGIDPDPARGDRAARARWFRQLADVLAAGDRLRPAAAAYWRALRLERDLRREVAAADWAPLAAVYRELWRRSRNARYLRWYLRFSRERTDEAQTRLARQCLAALRRRRSQCSQRT
ncbi:MAG TPA: hypothetical protein VF282_03925 [Bacillota bacterium]